MADEKLAVALRTMRLEGCRAVLARLADRRCDAAWRRRLVAGPRVGRGEVAVLNVLSTPPAVRLGGVQVQLQVRLAAEASRRRIALLYHEGGAWRLLRPGGSAAGEVVGASRAPGASLRDEAFATAVRHAVTGLGGRAVHVENVAGLPLGSLLDMAQSGPPLVLSTHDFALFCPRPHLIEEPVGRFCGYSTDAARCAACLAHDSPAPEGFQEQRRALARDLLDAARAVVFPSRFAADTHRQLFAGLDGARWVVIPPAAPPPPRTLPPRAPGPVRRVALLGPLKPHKGGALFAEVVRCIEGLGLPLEIRVYGGGDAELLGELRRLKRVRVRGSYRAGALPGLLTTDRIDLALLLSTWPETHVLVLDECAAAGVPVVTFNLGAQGARVRELGLGETVAPSLGAAGVAEVVARLARAPQGPVVPSAAVRRLATPAEAARAHLALYRRLGLD